MDSTHSSDKNHFVLSGRPHGEFMQITADKRFNAFSYHEMLGSD